MLALLLSIITFTLTSTTGGTYDYEGDEPVGMECTYDHTATSGSKGQMTAGNSTTLTITGWKGYTIKSVSLSMKSNKSAGAGKLEMTVDGQPVWTISDSKFSSNDWHGTFSQAYVSIEHTFSPEAVCSQGDVSIYIEASENSLYIESYTIEYEIPLPHPYILSCQVTDDMVLPITEAAVGAGVILPTAPDMNGWYFVGWVSNVYSSTTTLPTTIYKVGTRYSLTDDDILYALYQDVPPSTTSEEETSPHIVQETEYKDGDYIIAVPTTDSGEGYIAYDYPKSYHWPLKSTTDITFNGVTQLYEIKGKSSNFYENEIYSFRFNTTDSMVTIKCKSSNNRITYGTTYKLIVSGTEVWNYRVTKDKRIVIYIRKGGVVDEKYPLICYSFVKLDPVLQTQERVPMYWDNSALLLFPITDEPEEEPVVITYKTLVTRATDPIPSPVEDIEMDDNSEVVYYNLLGQKVPKEVLSNGVYIRRVGKHVEKIYYYE